MVLYSALAENGKRYIGVSKYSLEERKKQHERSSRNPKNKFHRAIKKYGLNSFVWEVLDTANSSDELMFKEVEYIRFFDSKKKGYNSTDGGEGTKGHVVSEEARTKLRAVSKSFWSTKTKEEIQELTKHLSVTGGWNKKQILDNKGNIFKSVSAAAQFHNMSIGGISLLLSQKRPSKSGLCFKIYEGYIEIFNFEKAKIKKSKYSPETLLKFTGDHLKKKIIDSNGVIYNSVTEAAKLLKISRSRLTKILTKSLNTKNGLRLFYVR